MRESSPYEVELIRETDDAILVDDGDNQIWLPKSQVEYDENAMPEDIIEVEVPEWLAYDKGMI